MDKKLLIQKRNERYRGLYNASEKVTNINRTLSIAGIAQVWLFLNYNPSIDERNILFAALCLFVSSIILEYLSCIICLFSYFSPLTYESSMITSVELLVAMNWTACGYIDLTYCVAKCAAASFFFLVRNWK